TTARTQLQDIAGLQHHACLIGLERAVGTALGFEPVAVRRPILASDHPARAVLHAVAGRIADRRFRSLDDHFELGARTTAIAAIATAVGAELVTAEEKGKAHLVHFDAAELD